MFTRSVDESSKASVQNRAFVRNKANELLNHYSKPELNWPIFAEFLDRMRVANLGPMDAHAGPIRLAFPEINTDLYFDVEYRGVGYGENNSIEFETIVSAWNKCSEESLLALKRKSLWKSTALASH